MNGAENEKKSNITDLYSGGEVRPRSFGAAQSRVIPQAASFELPLYYENSFYTDDRAAGVHADSPSDGLVLSLSALGRVDIEFIAAATGMEHRDIITALKGSIFQNPEKWEGCFYLGWETADEYLSGNLRAKLDIARRANISYHGWFDDNVIALKAAMPPQAGADEIFVSIGSPWVPSDVFDAFIVHMLGESGYFGNDDPALAVRHDELTGTWEIPAKDRYYRNSRSFAVYGTHRMEALEILERTLNLKSVAVYDEVPCPSTKSGKRRVLNRAETAAANEKQALMQREFRFWVWRENSRRKRLEAIFAERYGSYRRRRFDGSFLDFPEMNKNVDLYPYQKDAVARILLSPNTLLAHDVGAGKTYIMIAAGMEARRMGISKKNLYAVPNNIVGQWERMFKEMYPSAKLLVIPPKSFTPARRNEILAAVRDCDCDAIIMAHSTVDMIPLSRNYYGQKLRDRRAAISEAAKDGKKTTAAVRRECKRAEEKLKEFYASRKKDPCEICFDELGITMFFVDEAHCYKNVPIETKLDNVLGISSGGSAKCTDMLDRVHTVQRANNGGGVVMATGTPITNSVSDVFVFQQYLQSGELALLDLSVFDAWVGMFAERVTEFEVDVDTKNYRMATRLARFHNLPELTALLSGIADFHKVENERGLPEAEEIDRIIPRTPEFEEYLDEISRRADRVRQGKVALEDDNMLKITGDGRRAALDLRIVKEDAPQASACKVAACADAVFEIYKSTAPKRCSQLVFCDTSTPKAGFNVYDALTELLVGRGVNRDEIAYVHDAESERERDPLFAAVQSGRVRILIGSTFKLGMGVNVQERLIAVHHLDVPWRPADMVQREGRMVRQGNENPRVFVYRYITEGSFDAYSWQLLETKQKFISELLGGMCKERSGNDIAELALSYGEIKALAVGNPLIRKRVELVNELTRLSMLQNKSIEDRERMQRLLLSIPDEIAELNARIADMTRDAEFVERSETQDTDKVERKLFRERLFSALKAHIKKPEDKVFAEYRGFTVVLPHNAVEEKLSVFLVRSRRYHVETGNTEKGALARIDNFIDGLRKNIERAQAAAASLGAEIEQLRQGLSQNVGYFDRIEAVRAEIAEIDERLKVKK